MLADTGVLTVLSFLSFYALVRCVALATISCVETVFDRAVIRAHRRGSRKDPTTIALCLALLALLVSTTTHLVTNVLFHLSNILSAIITSKSSLWSYGGYSQWSAFPSELVKDYSKAQSCATTAALTINVCLPPSLGRPSCSPDSGPLCRSPSETRSCAGEHASSGTRIAR